LSTTTPSRSSRCRRRPSSWKNGKHRTPVENLPLGYIHLAMRIGCTILMNILV
jgi:hypothetical protein